MAHKMNGSFWAVALFSCLVVTLAPANVHAQSGGFQSGFVGWTNMTETDTADGLINFAVYRPSVGDSNWTDDFGPTIGAQILAVPGSGTLDTNTFEVLFFQMVNTDPPVPDGNINNVLISDPLGLITSVGYIDGRVFKDKDASGNVGPSGNRVIGSETDPVPNPSLTPDDLLDGVPTRSDRSLDLDSSQFGTEGAAVNPSTADTVGGFRRFNWSFPGIPDLGFSSVFFVTTDHGPSTYREGRLGNSDSGAFSNGDIPSPNPEPGPLVLVLVGVLGYAGYSLKKTKQVRADAGLQTAPVAI